jgi:transcriptional regulator with XRE-family HTH domain
MIEGRAHTQEVGRTRFEDELAQRFAVRIWSHLSLIDPGTALPRPKVDELGGQAMEFAWCDTQTSPELIDASWRERRQHLSGQTRKAATDHVTHYAKRLADATDRNARRSVIDLLTELSEARGVTWSDIAAALGISIPGLRKWRKSVSGTTPENHRALAELAAFFGVLAQVVDSPARWMSMPLVSGFNVTPFDVYSTEHAAKFLDLAAGNVGVTAEGVLDAVAPDWRERWRSQYEVFEAVDGELSMRPRQA